MCIIHIYYSIIRGAAARQRLSLWTWILSSASLRIGLVLWLIAGGREGGRRKDWGRMSTTLQCSYTCHFTSLTHTQIVWRVIHSHPHPIDNTYWISCPSCPDSSVWGVNNLFVTVIIALQLHSRAPLQCHRAAERGVGWWRQTVLVSCEGWWTVEWSWPPETAAPTCAFLHVHVNFSAIALTLYM